MRRNGWLAGVIGMVVLASALGLGLVGVAAQDGGDGDSEGGDVDYTWSGDVNAPDFPQGADWINVSEPISIDDLRGKVVLLDFWTYGCINCIHNQPAYKDWHERFSSKGAVVLGIHTPEGEGDRKLESIRKALHDQGLAYAVAVDNKKENWTAWANHMWPSVYLIDKEGYVRYWWYGEMNWQGVEGEKWMRSRIQQLLAEPD